MHIYSRIGCQCVLLLVLMGLSAYVFYSSDPAGLMVRFQGIQTFLVSPSSCPTVIPTNVTVTPKGFIVNNSSEPFLVKGIGYSPTPPGMYPDDYYTNEFAYLFARDMPHIREMGANVIRVWTWFTSSDHSEFYRTLDGNETQSQMYLLLPFVMDKTLYPDLSDPDVRQAVLIDWTAFVRQHKDVPAVFAYMIGNELDREYPNELDYLFSLVNTMSAQRIEVETNNHTTNGTIHPVTIPLSYTYFQTLLEDYYPYAEVDFWSVQVYVENISIVYDLYNSTVYSLNEQMYPGQDILPKPLLITEFGTDAYSNSSAGMDQAWARQGNILSEMWETIAAQGVGACIMEWNDEWWKSNVPDPRSTGCPNGQPDIQAACGVAIDNVTFLHEAYLGLTYQTEPDELTSSYCVIPRYSYYNITELWNGTATNSTGPYQWCQQSFPWPFSQIPLPARVVVILAFSLFVIILLVASIITIYVTRRRAREEEARGERLLQTQDDTVNKWERYEAVREQLHGLLRDAFQRYKRSENCQPACICDTCIPRQRLFHLIWDKYLMLKPSPESISRGDWDQDLLNRAVMVVYVRFMEGYHIYCGKTLDEVHTAITSMDNRKMIDELALWNMITQYASAINHSPEKVCQVYEHFLQRQSGFNSEEVLGIFKYYYMCFEQGYTFEDINEDAIKVKRSRTCSASLWTLTSMRTYLDYQPFISIGKVGAEKNRVLEMDRAPLADWEFLRNQYNKTNETNTYMSKCFPQRGGILTAFYNFSWLVRLDVWMICLAYYFSQDNSLCIPQLLQILAKVDWIVKTLALLLHITVVTFPLTTFKSILHFLIYLVAGIGIWGPSIGLNIGGSSSVSTTDDSSGVSVTVEGGSLANTYLLITGIAALGEEIYLGSIVRCPYNLPGRMRRNYKLSFYPISEEIWVTLCNVVFYFLMFAGVLYFDMFLVDAVTNLTFDNLCTCDLDTSQFVLTEYNCDYRTKFDCKVAVIFTQVAAALVSMVFLFAAFQFVMLLFGIMQAKGSGIARIKEWEEAQVKFQSILPKGLETLSGSLKDKKKQEFIWARFVDSLEADFLLSEEEKKQMLIGDFSFVPANAEAQRRILQFLYSLEMMSNTEVTQPLPIDISKNQILTMPSWTVMVPVFEETIVYSHDELITKGDSSITTIEYLVAIYENEWTNFNNQLIAKKLWAGTPTELMNAFLRGSRELNKDLIERIQIWASLHGQTVIRTVKGLINHRAALYHLARMEIPEAYFPSRAARDEAVKTLIYEKFQIIIAHQRYSPTNNEFLPQMELLIKFVLSPEYSQFGGFDLVYDNVDKKSNSPKYYTVMERIAPPGIKAYGYEAGLYKIRRPGPLKLGEGKASNQIHALQMAVCDVLQVNDMNQYNTVDNSLKVPFILNSYFNNAEDALTITNGTVSSSEDLSPKYRVLGFPEYTYTRPLSHVGELMGAAEWSFVTIFQRVLTFPLQVRAHYGHPDFLDGYWVRTRGGPSKASTKVNTNEDIFTGYELFGRGERVGYIEYLEAQKGRESGFYEATVFEMKLAQGAAQQVRSRDVYMLNQYMPFFRRMSLFLGSIGFYISNMLMSMSISFYLYGLVLFAISRISYHQMGLLGGVISVPWLIQVGFVQAIPLLAELIITRGFIRGFLKWLVDLPLGMVFFIFHLRTKAHYFALGILKGGGGYLATSRGFGLKRYALKDLFMKYSTSHFTEALELLAGLIIYAIVTTDSFSTGLVRMLYIILVVISWFLAPVLFNPFPSASLLLRDIRDMALWLSTNYPRYFRGVEVWPSPKKDQGNSFKVICSETFSTTTKSTLVLMMDCTSDVQHFDNNAHEVFRIRTLPGGVGGNEEYRYLNSLPQADAVYHSLRRRFLTAGYKRVSEDTSLSKDFLASRKKWQENSWQIWNWYELDKHWMPPIDPHDPTPSFGWLLIQKAMMGVWRVILFVITMWMLFDYDALVIFILILLTQSFLFFTNSALDIKFIRYSRVMVIFTVIPTAIWYYTLSDIDVSHLLASMLIIGIAIYTVSGVLQELHYIFYGYHRISRRKINDEEEAEPLLISDRINTVTREMKDPSEAPRVLVAIRFKEPRLLKLLRIKLMDGCLAVLKIVPYLLLFGLSIGSFITVALKRFLVTVLYSAKVQEVAYRGFDIKNLGGFPAHPPPPGGFSGTYTKQTAVAAEQGNVRINVLPQQQQQQQQQQLTATSSTTGLHMPIASPAMSMSGALPPLVVSNSLSNTATSTTAHHPRQSSYTSSPHSAIFLPSNFEATLPSPPPPRFGSTPPASMAITPVSITIPSSTPTTTTTTTASIAINTPQNPKSLLLGSSSSVHTPSTPHQLESRITGLRSLFQILDSLSCTSDDHRNINADMSDDWATGHGINKALTNVLGPLAYIVHPDTCSISSPLDSDYDKSMNGIVNYTAIINEYYRGPETKPIVMVLNTTSTAILTASTDASPSFIKGTHWVLCVILPKNYSPPSSDFGEPLKNSIEQVYFIDSLSEKSELPRRFREALLRGVTNYEVMTDVGLHTQNIPALFIEGADFYTCSPTQQAGSSDCGWWAVYNAIMLVLTGRSDFLGRFTRRSRVPAGILRRLFPNLTEESPGFDPLPVGYSLSSSYSHAGIYGHVPNSVPSTSPAPRPPGIESLEMKFRQSTIFKATSLVNQKQPDNEDINVWQEDA